MLKRGLDRSDSNIFLLTIILKTKTDFPIIICSIRANNIIIDFNITFFPSINLNNYISYRSSILIEQSTSQIRWCIGCKGNLFRRRRGHSKRVRPDIIFRTIDIKSRRSFNILSVISYNLDIFKNRSSRVINSPGTTIC